MSRMRLTGHPFIDIGLATLAALAGVRTIEALSQSDLQHDAERLTYWYSSHNGARNYISTVFTNSHFTQPSMSQEQREAYADRYLFAFSRDHAAADGEERCVFFQELAAVERAYRQHVPLLNGERISNFSGMGRDGLPVSGLALLALHALPLGCLKCGGRLLGFHQQTAEPGASNLQLPLVRNIYKLNEQALSMLPADEPGKFPDFGGRARLRYVTQVINARQNIANRGASLDYITGYYFTNYGASAEMTILRLDHTVMSFINRVLLEASDSWNRAVFLGWQRGKKGELESDDDSRIANSRRNFVYEELFNLPAYTSTRRFLKLLKTVRNWQLIAIFLEEILLMEQERIDVYRRLGDLMTEYALNYENQPLSFFYKFSRAKNYTVLRGEIKSAAEKMYKKGTDTVLFTYDDFIAAFEHPSERYSQWKLASDLIAIRMLENLHQANIDLSELEEDTTELQDFEEKENA